MIAELFSTCLTADMGQEIMWLTQEYRDIEEASESNTNSHRGKGIKDLSKITL